jgi:uncharacterized protein (TIGR02145 family)
MLTKDGTIKLADFGIAKDMNSMSVTQTGTQMGTPMYMSPEQIKSTKDVDLRSDIYSLGVVLYEMVAGTYPFDKDTLSLPEIQVCILRDLLPLTHTRWDEQIQRATAKQEADRFQSCNDWISFKKLNIETQKEKDNDRTIFEITHNNDSTILDLPKNNNLNSILIGKQLWASENLNVDSFRNGDLITEARTIEEWIEFGVNKKPAFCYYENDPTNGDKYGKLYNWYAVNDSRGLTPKGWHVPSDSEWTQLAKFLESTNVAGQKKKNSGGLADNVNKTKKVGFSGMPGGSRNIDGCFNYIGVFCCWWSTTEYSSFGAYVRYFGRKMDLSSRYFDEKEMGLSVRFIKD